MNRSSVLNESHTVGYVTFVACARRLEEGLSESSHSHTLSHSHSQESDSGLRRNFANIQAVYLFKFHTEHARGLWTVDRPSGWDLGVNENVSYQK
jgi:hypothetical protein